MLYKTLDDVKNSAGFVSISNKTNDLSILKEDLMAAEHDVRINYLGAAQFDLLDTSFNTDAILAGSDLEKLLHHTRRYCSMMALRSGAAKINVDFGKSGITSPKTQTSVPAREWMLVQLQNSLLQSACTHLDVLLRFLEEKRDVFTLWKNDTNVSLTQRRFFLQSLPAFQKYYGLANSYVTYKALWPIMEHVQERYLSKLLGQDFYDSLIAELNAANISANNNLLLDKYLNRLVAYKTIIRACEILPIRVDYNGIVTNEYIASNETTSQQVKAELNAIRIVKNQLQLDAAELQEDLIAYLNKTASASVFTEWFSSDLYDDPTDDAEEDNEINQENSGFFKM